MSRRFQRPSKKSRNLEFLLLASSFHLMPFETAAAAAATIKLHFIPAAGGKPTAIAVYGDGGVDLGAVGRAVGLESSSVRLNGYFLSRGNDFISGFTWSSLLSFFSARGLPKGISGGDPITVQGKPIVFSDENPLKRILESGDGQLNDDDSLCIKRRLRLEDNYPSKKGKLDCNSGPPNEASKLPSFVAKTKFSYSCINGHRKRSREGEMASALSCKRVRQCCLAKR